MFRLHRWPTMFRRFGFLLLALLAGPAITAGARETVARCAGGDELARALRALEEQPPGPVVVHVSGRCRGPVEIARDELTLLGDDPDQAAIEGGSSANAVGSPIVAIRRARGVRLENLRIADGAVGVRAIDAETTLEGCDLVRADVAIDAQGATVTLVRTTLREARNGLAARRSRIAVSLGAIRDVSDEGILATEASQIALFRTAVASDGLAIGNLSTLVATHCALEGSIHADGYSRISLAGTTGPTATLRGDLFASNSEVALFRLPVEGAVRMSAASHARIAGAEITGDLLLDGFSTAELSTSSVVGELVCRNGADAACAGSVPRLVSGCRSCGP